MKPFKKRIWLSCILIDETAMCKQERTDKESHYELENGKTCPDAIMEKLAQYVLYGRLCCSRYIVNLSCNKICRG